MVLQKYQWLVTAEILHRASPTSAKKTKYKKTKF